eukprot:1143257-Pelagomonas_calceolata.AAC.3
MSLTVSPSAAPPPKSLCQPRGRMHPGKCRQRLLHVKCCVSSILELVNKRAHQCPPYQSKCPTALTSFDFSADRATG